MKMPRKELQLLISLSAKHTVFIIIVPKMRKLNSFNKDSWLADYLDLAAMEQEVTVLRFLATGTRTQASRVPASSSLSFLRLYAIFYILSVLSFDFCFLLAFWSFDSSAVLDGSDHPSADCWACDGNYRWCRTPRLHLSKLALPDPV